MNCNSAATYGREGNEWINRSSRFYKRKTDRRGDGVAERAGLENRRTLAPNPLPHKPFRIIPCKSASSNRA